MGQGPGAQGCWGPAEGREVGGATGQGGGAEAGRGWAAGEGLGPRGGRKADKERERVGFKEGWRGSRGARDGEGRGYSMGGAGEGKRCCYAVDQVRIALGTATRWSWQVASHP